MSAGISFDDLIPQKGQSDSDLSFDDLIPASPETTARDPNTPPNASSVPAAAPAAAAPSLVDRIMGYADDTGAIFGREARRGVSALLGAPVDLINNAPRLANLIPGVDGVGPISDKPVLGGQWVDEALGGFGVIPEAPKPQDGFQRVVGRVGYEVGANALPVAGAVGVGSRMGVDAARALARSPNAAKAIVGNALEAGAVNPAGLAGREAAAAVASGAGAGAFNEAAGNPQQGDNFWSDFLGSATGLGILGLGKAAIGTLGNLYSGATGTTRFTDDVVGEEVANRIINSSTQMGERAASGMADWNDTTFLANQLRRPAEIEDAVPGYRANIADRTQDPGLATFAFNQDALSPGAANARRVGNEAAVDERMAGLDPGGDPAQFRSAIEASVDRRTARADQFAEANQARLDAATQRLTPSTPYAEDRGAAVRAGVQNAERALRESERGIWQGIDGEVDPAPLAQGLEQARGALPVARQQVIADLGEALGIPASFDGPVGMGEINALRSRLTTAQRNALSGPQPDRNRAEAIGRMIDEVDTFMNSDAVPPATREQIETARGVSRNVNERFNRPNDPIAEIIAEREGRPNVPDSGVAKRFVQPDSGQASNIDRLLAETDLTSRAQDVRRGLRDEILADVEKRRLLDKPEQLDRYLDSYSRVFDRFPDLRDEIATAGQTSRSAQQSRETADTLRRDLTTPGRSAEASYLRYDNEATVDAVRNLTSGPKPREAAKELLAAAGNTPEARQNARSALWEVVKTKKFSAPGITGGDRWDGKKLKAVFDDPKTAAVADELWSDSPAELDDIKRVFSALAGAEGSGRARAVGSSGTPQALNGKFDPSLSASSIASRARSVNRGQLSPTIAVVDLASTWLRNRSKQVQSRAIDTIASAAVNNPGMAADLLEKYNPANYAARRRMISQKYGVRATQLLNLLDEIHEEDGDLKETINGR